MERLKDDDSLLDRLIDKVNGNEKNQLLTYLYKFLSSADGYGAEEYRLPEKAGFDAKYSKGKVIISTYYYIDRKISRYKYRYIEKNRKLNPFTNVTFCYGNDQNEITVPAIVLVKSRGDVVLYDDFYESNIDWQSLSEEKKRELYTEFVLQYLPKELGDAAVGNPVTFIVMIIVGYAIAKLSIVFAAIMTIFGTFSSLHNIIDGYNSIRNAVESYSSLKDVNEAKSSARQFAHGLAQLGIEIIPVVFGLIKRGVAKFRRKELRLGEETPSVKRIEKLIEVKFKIKKKFDVSEYKRQLQNQENGLNKLTIQKYLDNISKYRKNGRGTEATKLQKQVRNVEKAKKIAELRRKGHTSEDAEKLAGEWIKTQATLHNSDMSAGGNPLDVIDVGDARINSSIGSQWGNENAELLESQIRDSIKSIDPKDYTTTFLNVKLITE